MTDFIDYTFPFDYTYPSVYIFPFVYVYPLVHVYPFVYIYPFVYTYSLTLYLFGVYLFEKMPPAGAQAAADAGPQGGGGNVDRMVPLFSGDLKGYREYRKRVEIFKMRCRLMNRTGTEIGLVCWPVRC